MIPTDGLNIIRQMSPATTGLTRNGTMSKICTTTAPGLKRSLPSIIADEEWLRPIPGQPPSLINLPSGCAFHPRCHLGEGRPLCRKEVPPVLELAPGRRTACHYHDEMSREVHRIEEETGATIEGETA
jgi:oligopeptide/dipeptide ABC transporter ATP-binding protein